MSKVKFYTTKKKFNSNISLGFFTRQGGYSNKDFKSLNCSYNSGDNKNLVKKNILIAKKNLNLNNKSIKLLNQVHSNKVILINKKNYKNNYLADGIITQDKNICIAILTADCCPIFFFDTEGSFISCIHAGWKGCYLNIIKSSLIKIKKIQTNNKKINAIIGPCLKKNNFEVDSKFRSKFVLKDKKYEKFFFKKDKKDKFLFDMKSLIKYQILENDINNIENINLDTYDNKKLFFSHRRSTHLKENLTGRMINIIGFAN